MSTLGGTIDKRWVGDIQFAPKERKQSIPTPESLPHAVRQTKPTIQGLIVFEVRLLSETHKGVTHQRRAIVPTIDRDG